MSAIMKRFLARPDVSVLDAASLPGFIATGTVVLFFTGNAARYPEIADIAVVLPELRSALGRNFRIGVIDPDKEQNLAGQYRISICPTLVLLHDGVVLGTLPRLRDWAVYLGEFSRLPAGPVTEAA